MPRKFYVRTPLIFGGITDAIKGMVANPSDREAAVRPLVEATGGKLLAYYATTGDNDFLMICEAPEGGAIVPALIVAGATGTVSNLKTVHAFSGAEFKAMQEKAGGLAGALKPAG